MTTHQNQIVAGTERGDTTINVRQLLDRPWYRYKHLRNLYAWLTVVLIVQATNGLYGSIMNGMQTLTYLAVVLSLFDRCSARNFQRDSRTWKVLFPNSSHGGLSKRLAVSSPSSLVPSSSFWESFCNLLRMASQCLQLHAQSWISGSVLSIPRYLCLFQSSAIPLIVHNCPRSSTRCTISGPRSQLGLPSER